LDPRARGLRELLRRAREHQRGARAPRPADGGAGAAGVPRARRVARAPRGVSASHDPRRAHRRLGGGRARGDAAVFCGVRGDGAPTPGAVAVGAQALEDAPCGRAAALLMAGRGRKRTVAARTAKARTTRALERQLARVRRAADRRLAAMVAEIAALRHHEARAEALARLLAEREAALAAERARVAELEARLATAGSAPRKENGGDGEDPRAPRG